MTSRINDLQHRALPALAEWYLLLPIWFPLAIYILPEDQLFIWPIVMAVVILLGVLIQTIYPLKKQWMTFFLSLLVVCAVGYLWPSDLWGKLMTAILTGGFFFRSMKYGLHHWQTLLHPNLSLSSLVLFFVGHFFFQQAVKLQPYSSTFSLLGVLALGIVLYITNTTHLQASALTRDSDDSVVVRPIMRTNRLYLSVIFILIIGISLFDTIWTYLTGLVKKLLSLISLGSEEPVEDVAPLPQPAQGGVLPMERGEASWLARALEVVFQWIAYLIAFVAFILLLYAIYRGARALYRRILAFLGKTTEKSETATGYIDEKESLLGKVAKDNKQRWSKLWDRWTYREPKWSDLQNNKDRARFLFRGWLRHLKDRGFSWHAYQTPDELVKEAARWQKLDSVPEERSISTYHKARYGPPDIEPTDDEISTMKAQLKK